MMGAPVFALMGYAAASHDIPRGFAVPQFGLARAKIYRRGNAMGRFTAEVMQWADLPQGYAMGRFTAG